MKVDSTEFVGYFPKMRELAKAGAVLTIEDGEKAYEFRVVRDLPPMSLEQWREANKDRFKTMGTARYDYEEGPIIPIEEWGSLA